MASNIKMLCRILNPKRASLFLGFGRRSIHHQDHSARQIKPLYQFFQPRNFSKLANTKVEEDITETSQLSGILFGEKWCDKTEERLNRLSTISEEEVLLALKALKLNPTKARNFFKWYTTYHSYKSTASLYNALLKVVCQKNHLCQFWRFVEEMKQHGFSMEPSTFSTSISRLHKYQRPEDMGRLFLWMFEDGKNECTVSKCCQVLLGNGSGDASRVVEEVLNDDDGDSMKKMVYDGLHRCLTKDGRLEEAQKVMDAMMEEGYVTDNKTYGHLVYGLCNANRLEDAKKLIHEIQGKENNLDSRAWEIVIDGLYKADKTDEALAMCGEMIESKGKNVINYSVIQGLVVHLCKKNRGMDAYNLMFNSIEDRKLKPSHGTYLEVIKELTSSGMLQEALKTFDVMMKKGFMPVNSTYAQLVYKLCNASRFEEACKIIHAMQEKGRNLCSKTWKSIFESLYEVNETDKAVAFFIKMVESGCNVKYNATQNVVVRLCKENRELDAYNLMCKVIEDLKIKPSYETYLEIINKLAGSGMLEKAFKMFDLMKQHGYPPYIDSLYESIAKSGTVDEAYSLIKKVKSGGVSGKACVCMMKAFYSVGRQSEIRDLISKFPHYIANSSDILNLSKGTSSGTPTIEDSTENGQKGDTSHKGEAIDKGKNSKKTQAEIHMGNVRRQSKMRALKSRGNDSS